MIESRVVHGVPWIQAFAGRHMSVLAPTPPERLMDAEGRPYFPWDEDPTLDGLPRLSPVP
jgi:hypothetical protein